MVAASICSYPATAIEINKYYVPDLPPPSTYGCSETETYDAPSKHFSGNHVGWVHVCGLTQLPYAEFYDCSTAECSPTPIEIYPHYPCNPVCHEFSAHGSFHIYVDTDDIQPNPVIFGYEACPDAWGSLASVTAWFDNTDATAAAYNSIVANTDVVSTSYGDYVHSRN